MQESATGWMPALRAGELYVPFIKLRIVYFDMAMLFSLAGRAFVLRYFRLP
jgi:hypothetical protein